MTLVSPTNLVQLLEAHQHVPRLAAIRRPEDPRQLQLVDDPRRSTVPDAHAPLQQRRRAELVLDAHLGRLPEQPVAFAGAFLPFPRPSPLLPLFLLVDRRDLPGNLLLGLFRCLARMQAIP